MSSVSPFPIRRLRILAIAVMVAAAVVYTWVIVIRAGENHDLVRAAIVGGVVRVGIGTLIICALTHAIAVRDRRLQSVAADLTRMVDERTREVEQRGRGMRRVLDHVDQGLVAVDTRGVMDGDRSAMIERWLGPAPADATFGEVIGRHSMEFAIWFELGLDALRDALLPIDVVLGQFPRRFTIGERMFEVAYSPILDGERLERLLLVISDVSARVERERAERGEREAMRMFQRISHDRTGFEEFIDETSDLVATLDQPAEPVGELRLLHTLKGNCRLYGLEGYADLCHAIEDELNEGRSAVPLTADQRDRLRAGWREVATRVSQLLGDSDRQVVELERSELAAAVERVRRGAAGRDLAALLASWAHEPVSRRFERLGLHAQQLARRLGKGEIELSLRSNGIRLEPGRWAPFWRGLVLAVNNAVDHGLEPPAERMVAGKPARGMLSLSARVTQRGFEVSIADDGCGVDWASVRARAIRAGLPCATGEELEETLFKDGVSTRDEATATSGRGVGLAALRETTLQLGGTMQMESRTGAGTTLTFTFPGQQVVVPLRPPSQRLGRLT